MNTNSVYTGNTSTQGGAQNRFTNAFTWRAREDFDIDTRTATEYGVVRTYFDSTFTWTSDGYGGNGVGGTVYGPTAVGIASSFGTNQNNVFANPNNAGSGAVAGGTLGMYYAFIQFAGFTMGKAISQFSAPWTAYPGNNYDGLVGGGGTVTGVNQFTYTWEMGNGISASISAQDPSAYYQAGVNNVFLSAASTNGSGVNAGTAGFTGAVPAGGQFANVGNNTAFPLANLGNSGAFGTSDYGGTSIPDVVGMLRVDQAWGLFQLSAAAHDNVAAYYGATELSGHPGDRWGYAVQAALSIKNIPTGPGDTINVQGVYTNGATRYNIQDLAAAAGAATIYGGEKGTGTGIRTVGLGVATDTVFGPGGQQQLTQTWGMRGGYTHNWNAYWNSGIYGAYASVNYNGGAKTLLCGTGPTGTGGSIRAVLNPSAAAGTVPASAITTCNPDYNIAQLGFITRWTPVKNLTFSIDYTYTNLDQKMSGTVVLPSALIGKPAVLYTLSDQSTHQALLRVQRNW